MRFAYFIITSVLICSCNSKNDSPIPSPKPTTQPSANPTAVPSNLQGGSDCYQGYWVNLASNLFPANGFDGDWRSEHSRVPGAATWDWYPLRLLSEENVNSGPQGHGSGIISDSSTTLSEEQQQKCDRLFSIWRDSFTGQIVDPYGDINDEAETVWPYFSLVIDFPRFTFPKTKREYEAMTEETEVKETSGILNMTWYGPRRSDGSRWNAFSRSYDAQLRCEKPYVVKKATVSYKLDRVVSPEFCTKGADAFQCQTFEVKHDGDNCDVVMESQEFRGPSEGSSVQATVFARYFKASGVQHFEGYTGAIFQIKAIKLQ